MSKEASECFCCKSKNIVQLSDENKVYGLVQITPPANVNYSTLIPVNVFCCKDCGHIELVHVQPQAIQK